MKGKKPQGEFLLKYILPFKGFHLLKCTDLVNQRSK